MGVLKVTIFLLFTLLYTNASAVDEVTAKNLSEKVLNTTENVNKDGIRDTVISTSYSPENTTTTTSTTTTSKTTTSSTTPSTTSTVAPTTPSTTTTTPSIPTTTTNSNTTTTAASTTTSTTLPPPTPPPKPNHRFDFPSFIGGVIFTLGLIAIGFLLHKFYKARTDRNYHTL